MGRSPRLCFVLAFALFGPILVSGCVSLEPATVPSKALDVRAGNGWVRNQSAWSGPGDGWFSKQAVRAYTDNATDGRGYKGFVQVTSIRAVLSPDREELRDRVEDKLRQDAAAKGLALSHETNNGTRTLANGALSFYTTFNATQQQASGPFQSNAQVNVIGEVFRCTGGATVIVTGSAQVAGSSSLGGIPTSDDYKPRTWKEIVQDPSGTIDGFQGNNGLLYNIRCA